MCLLDRAGKGSVKASVQVQVKGIKYYSAAREPLIKDGQGQKAACWMEERAVSILNQDVIPCGWKVQKKASITKYHPDPVKQVMEDKNKDS